MTEISDELQKRLEYDARQKALYDYNTMMIESRERGRAEGREEGREEGRITRDKELRAQMIADGVDEAFIRRYFGSV